MLFQGNIDFLQATYHSDGAKIREANERLRNPLRLFEKFLLLCQGITHSVFSLRSKNGAYTEGSEFVRNDTKAHLFRF